VKNLIYILLSAAVFWNCSNPAPVAGTTDTGNAIQVAGTVLYENGDPAVDAEVRLRRKDYLSPLPSLAKAGLNWFDTQTNTDGEFVIDSLEPGDYFIEVSDQDSMAVLITLAFDSSDTRIELPVETLEKVSVVKGRASLSPGASGIFLQSFGLERLEAVDPATGLFSVTLPAGTFGIRFSSQYGTVKPVVVEDLPVSAGEIRDLGTIMVRDSTDPYSAWEHVSRVVVNTLPTGSDIVKNVYDFPLLIRLNSFSSFNFTDAQPNGDDLRFTKSDGVTPLPYEIERWDYVNGIAEVWVRIDTIYGSNDNQYIYVYTGNSDAPAVSNGQDVFDTAADFRGVWHFPSAVAPADTFADATFYGNDGINSGSDKAVGMIGLARSFNGATGYINMGSRPNLDDLPAYTYSAWIKPEGWGNSIHPRIFNKSFGDTGVSVHLYNEQDRSTVMHLKERDSINTVQSAENGSITLDTWYYVTAVVDTLTLTAHLYLNGSEVIYGIWDYIGEGAYTSDADIDLFIGNRAGLDRAFEGIIDECRVSSVVRSPEWIKMCYQNQDP
jgi:hypothetical protein